MEVFVTISLGLADPTLALVAFGLDSTIEVFASTVVILHLREGRDPAPRRTRLAFRLIAGAFFALAAFLLVASTRSLVLGAQPEESVLGIAYLALTAAVMFSLAFAKRRTARRVPPTGPRGRGVHGDLGGAGAGRSSAPSAVTGRARVGADDLGLVAASRHEDDGKATRTVGTADEST